jgi:LPXTG-motif cell wall-anchored protein
VRGAPLPLAVAVLGLALSPATLWAQAEDEPAAPVPPAEEVAPEPAPPVPEPEPPGGPSTPDPSAPSEEGDDDVAAPVEEPAAEPPAATPTTPVPPAPRQSSATVSMVDFAFQPSSTQISAGGSVTWTNDGEEPHDATANGGGFTTGTIEPGSSGSVSFDQAGNFSYFCTIHPGMTGSVTVLAADDGGGSNGGTDDPASDVPGPTEEAAVASPDAAGTDGDLPATGEETGLLTALGLILLAVGLQLYVAQRFSPR